ncbi:MAG: helix-turn-helix domain-containing protein [Acidimicrobiales bacterium]
MATADAPVPERLLDAALDVAAMHGLNRLSVGDVAKRAGLSRPTLYKHFASRDELVSQMVLREAGRIVEQVIAAAERHDDPFESLHDAILTALHALRGHPLLDRLLATEPEALLPLLIDGRARCSMPCMPWPDR